MNIIEQILPKLFYELIFEFKIWDLFDLQKLMIFIKNIVIRSINSITSYFNEYIKWFHLPENKYEE